MHGRLRCPASGCAESPTERPGDYIKPHVVWARVACFLSPSTGTSPSFRRGKWLRRVDDGCIAARQTSPLPDSGYSYMSTREVVCFKFVNCYNRLANACFVCGWFKVATHNISEAGPQPCYMQGPESSLKGSYAVSLLDVLFRAVGPTLRLLLQGSVAKSAHPAAGMNGKRPGLGFLARKREKETCSGLLNERELGWIMKTVEEWEFSIQKRHPSSSPPIKLSYHRP